MKIRHKLRRPSTIKKATATTTVRVESNVKRIYLRSA
jgi:hypothetical protein